MNLLLLYYFNRGGKFTRVTNKRSNKINGVSLKLTEDENSYSFM